MPKVLRAQLEEACRLKGCSIEEGIRVIERRFGEKVTVEDEFPPEPFPFCCPSHPTPVANTQSACYNCKETVYLSNTMPLTAMPFCPTCAELVLALGGFRG